MDERTVSASQFFDAKTLASMESIIDTLRSIDVTAYRIDPNLLANVRPLAQVPDQTAAIASMVTSLDQFDAVIKALDIPKLPYIVEQISAALLVARNQWAYDVVRSVVPPRTVNVDLIGDAVSDEHQDEELDTAEVEEQLERILELPDYQAEQLAISLGLTLDKVPARVGVVLVMSIMVVIQIVHPKLFDSLMEGKRNWTELFQGAARYWA